MPSAATTDTTATAERTGHRRLGSAEELRELLGEPHPIVIDKVRPRLIADDLELLSRSPFFLLSTSDSRGNCDASPRGDIPGFVRALDDRTLAVPDRPGNRRADSFHNILDNPHVGLVHLVPGSKEVLRINGRAEILTDAPFFDTMALKGQRPLLVLLIEIDEIFRHCPAALTRSGIWRPETWPEPRP
ncbi:MSMEG_1061 family FMN-dependent PPOX-type flavoprotein [Streptomyces corynorhini]|uniref:Pyridoxamine 5'-phosphate oxidase family protein n=1 Tax=Streptomyces corynorhini TaxID=2282652 RepID=A0A370BE76_9ACTN|nr:MSMEG_1061 family FMN-dependent PPOX-type flavoprotein [Streptomyces corynorhini]RDG40000.1 pyridoxamine 5'-phosphate oxidase family protein [Streptomyces corynorhini]